MFVSYSFPPHLITYSLSSLYLPNFYLFLKIKYKGQNKGAIRQIIPRQNKTKRYMPKMCVCARALIHTQTHTNKWIKDTSKINKEKKTSHAIFPLSWSLNPRMTLYSDSGTVPALWGLCLYCAVFSLLAVPTVVQCEQFVISPLWISS